MEHDTPESSVLPIFRLFAVLWLGLFLLGGGILLTSAAFSPQDLVFYLAGIANALVLLGYLTWPRLSRYLGDSYLLIGVGIASTGPIVISRLVSYYPSHSPGAQTTFDIWPLAAILFVPLVIIAWLHPLRDVIVYCLGTALLDLILAIPAIRGDGLLFLSTVHSTLGRTLSLLLVGYMVARIMKIQRQQRQSLAEANTRLTHYATTLEQLSVTRERNRLARELHDTLAHTLSAVAVELEAVDSLWGIDPVQAHTLLRRSLAATRAGLTETRRALQALRSSSLEDLGLALALRHQAEQSAARAGLALELEIPARLDNLAPDVEQCIYRVAQEALANAAQHAQARRVQVSLLREHGRLVLTISDDGCGFDLRSVDAASHLGIRGMRERAEAAGGSLEMTSEAGQGTRVCLSVEEKL